MLDCGRVWFGKSSISGAFNGTMTMGGSIFSTFSRIWLCDSETFRWLYENRSYREYLCLRIARAIFVQGMRINFWWISAILVYGLRETHILVFISKRNVWYIMIYKLYMCLKHNDLQLISHDVLLGILSSMDVRIGMSGRHCFFPQAGVRELFHCENSGNGWWMNYPKKSSSDDVWVYTLSAHVCIYI